MKRGGCSVARGHRATIRWSAGAQQTRGLYHWVPFKHATPGIGISLATQHMRLPSPTFLFGWRYPTHVKPSRQTTSDTTVAVSPPCCIQPCVKLGLVAELFWH